jgi:hypothetical protein
MIIIAERRKQNKLKLIGTFDQSTNARRVARNQAQKPGATRKIEDKRNRPVKHQGRKYDDC